MQKIMQLKKQIEQCDHELAQDNLRYHRSKQRFVTNITNIKNHLPAISTIVVVCTLILTFSTRARSMVGKLNKNILLGIVNARLAMSTVSMLINSYHHVNRFIQTSRLQSPHQ